MSNIEFACDHCQQRMAVGPELRGSVVRCPHCEQMVIAPVDESALVTEQVADSNLSVAPEPIVSENSLPADGDASQPTRQESTKPIGYRLRGSEVEAARRGRWVMAILVPYAAFMTVVAITYFLKFQNAIQEHPLELIPDLIGEYQRQQTKGGSQTLKLPDPAQPLPARFITALGRPIAIGAIEVTPLEIDYGPWTAYAQEKNHPEPEKRPVRDTLILHVRLRNISPELTFYPTDPYFDRRPKHANDRPYTLVEVGSHKFFGGLIEFDTTGGRYERSWVEGQEGERKPLRPGEVRDTVFLTRPGDGVLDAVKQSGEGAVWRIHVRRGLAPFRGNEVPVSAVVGVAFTAAEVHAAS